MPKKRAFHANQGTVWFLAILILSAFSAFYPQYSLELTMIIAICGAVVAILDITKVEETGYLLGSTSLILIIVAWKVLGVVESGMLDTFLSNLVVGFGIAGFMIALALIARIGLNK